MMSINSVRTLLENAAQSHGDKIAIKHDGASITYRELLRRVNQVAQYLEELGLPANARVGVYSMKSIDLMVAIMATLSTRYVLVPLTKLLQAEQVSYIINDCDIKVMITDKVKMDIVTGIDFAGKTICFETSDSNIPSFEEISKYYNKPYACKLNGHDNAVITYSFGLTGTPKGIVLSHRNLMDSARVVSNYLDLKEDDVISGTLIFNLDYGLNQLFSSLYKKATLALHRFILPEGVFNHLIEDEVTVLAVMPVHISELFGDELSRTPDASLFDKLRIITSSGGNVTAKMVKDCKEAFRNAKFYSMHGLTEAFRSTYLDPEQIQIRPDSIGKPIPDVELFLINEKGEACGPREVGELIHRGGLIYRGFWNAPLETAARFKSIQILKNVINLEGQLIDEIVVASGDYVYRDEEGYYYFVGRHDNMIKTRGFRVSPYEIESVVQRNIPQIIQCAVFGMPNEAIEEEIVMVYSARSEISDKEILFELKQHLASYMLPSRIIFMKSLPLVQSDKSKVDKQSLIADLS
jgi:acyl-CoA synthetase (AMP-forming)/AMP-acid ligase II